MYRPLLFTIVICVIYADVNAQKSKRTPEEKAQYYTKQMSEKIEIDSALYQKIYDVNLYISKLFDSLYNTIPDDDMGKKRGAAMIYKKRDSMYKSVLPIKLYLKYDDIQREEREKKMKRDKKEN